MGITLASAMNIAVGSLQTTSATLSNVSHNISNANTAGYSRQEVIQGNVSLSGSSAGVSISAVRRATDDLLVADLNEKRSALSYANTMNSYLGSIQTIFGTPGASSSPEKLITRMFNDISSLANSPDSSSLRVNVINDAQFVVDTLSAIEGQLQGTAQRADDQIDQEIVAVNTAIKKIADLNNEIGALRATGTSTQNGNDLMDERQRQIDIIAASININVLEEDNSRIRIITETGRTIVAEGYAQLERTPNTTGGTYQDIGIRTVKSNGSLSTTVLEMKSEDMNDGSIKALIDVRDVEIANLSAEMEELGAQLRDNFNLIHSQGTGIPPQNSFTTGNGFKLSGAGADITAELGINAGDSFEISIVDITTGQPIATTATTTVVPPTPGGSGPIVINAGDTLADVAAALQGNADVGGLLTATTIVDADGNSQIQVSANNPNYAIVLKNNTGNAVGELGFNNFFTGENLSELAVREDIVADPSKVATAQMRESDGGVSFVDNRNAIGLAQLADQEVSFNAAGDIAARNDTLTGYYVGVSSNLAVNISDSSDRLEFSQNLFNSVEERATNFSGVNMDEELSNLILFQRTYQASARVISVVDSMLETLVNLR